jgi:hypothetical protein
MREYKHITVVYGLLKTDLKSMPSPHFTESGQFSEKKFELNAGSY